MNLEKEIQASDFAPFSHTDLNAIYGQYTCYTIKGDLPEGASLAVDGKVMVQGAMPDHCKINATGSITLKGNVLNHVILRGQSIEGSTVRIGSNGSFEAVNGNISLGDIGKNNSLTSSGYIELLTAAKNLNAVAGGEFGFHEIGDHARVMAGQVTGGSTGRDSDITATKANVRLSHAGSRTRVFSAEPAQIVSQGSNVTLNEYFEEAPVTSVATKDSVQQKMMLTRIIYDSEEKQFVIPRTLAAEIDAGPFIDAAQDAGCVFKDAPATDTLCAVYIQTPVGMKNNVLRTLTDLANIANNPERAKQGI